MSKDNMLLGYARGKVGDVVFTRLKGQQVARAYNPNPNDKKSEAQIAQRVKLPSLVAFYQRNRTFFPYAFSTKKNQWSEYNAFVSANLLAGRNVFYAKGNLELGYPVVAPFIMSRGNMQQVSALFSVPPTAGSRRFVVAGGIVFDPKAEGTVEGAFGVDGRIDIGKASQMLINQNSFLQNGDMITFYVVATDKIGTGGSIVEQNLGNANRYFTVQLTLDISSKEKFEQNGLYLTTTDYESGTSFLCLQDYLETPPTDEADATSLYTMLNKNGVGACIVISRNSKSGVEVSYSEMHVNDNAKAYYDKYASDQAKAVAMESYQYNPDGLLKPRPNI